MGDQYEEDILVWSERQSDLLRRIAAAEPVSERSDWGNIIEEVESVGRSDLRAVRSLLLQALLHWLKAESWPDFVLWPVRAGRGSAVSCPGAQCIQSFNTPSDRYVPALR